VGRSAPRRALSERKHPAHHTCRCAVSLVVASDHCRLEALDVDLEVADTSSKFAQHDSHPNDLVEDMEHNASVLVVVDPDSG